MRELASAGRTNPVKEDSSLPPFNFGQQCEANKRDNGTNVKSLLKCAVVAHRTLGPEVRAWRPGCPSNFGRRYSAELGRLPRKGNCRVLKSLVDRATVVGGWRL